MTILTLLELLAQAPTVTYRPFLAPLPIDRWWLLMLAPLVLGVAVVYKALKTDDLAKLPRASVALAAQIAGFMALAAVGLWLLSEWF